MLEVRLLGSFEIRVRKKVVGLTSRPAQSLFAYLILNAGTAFRREKLAGQLWPESTEEAARDYLRHALWRIRKELQQVSAAAYLKADDLTISFDASTEYWLDAAAIRAVSEQSSTEELMKALAAYTGELLPGFYDEWVMLERQHLQGIYERKLDGLLQALQDGGRWDDVLDWSERWISLGQRPEAAYRHLMRAHAARGDLSKVVGAYERCVQSLKDFGVEPSESTRWLFESLKAGAQAAPAMSREPRQGRAREDSNSSSIPVPLSSFIGRQAELKHIAKLIKETRLLTLTGPGGVGKTRLAIQAAQNARKDFKEGVYWAALVGLSDPNLIPQEIAHALHIHEMPPEPLMQTVIGHLLGKQALLVLDNCEHLIRACAQYAEQLLAGCPNLKILATSIEGLGLFSETTWQVPSLQLPEGREARSVVELAEYGSIKLFDARARSAKSEFVLSQANAGAVTQICQRLDGIPLAIELAAARIKVLSVDEIAARLDDRFALLTSGSRTAIPRHQTLRATIDWSHDLLGETERVLFRRLAVFVGGFTLQAAEVICGADQLPPGDLLDALGRLVDKSLVVVESESVAGETRYRQLETIRQYALEKLVGSGDAPGIRQAHAEFYVRLAEESEPNIFGSASADWFRRLERELDNIRSAIEWSTTSGHAVLALRILGSLVYFWFARGHLGYEWNDRVQEALARPEGRERSLVRAKALNGIGFMYWADIYPTGKRAEMEEALWIARELKDPWNEALALHNLGLLEMTQGNYAESRTFLEHALRIWREMGSLGTMRAANTLIFLGEDAFNAGHAEEAHAYYEEAVGMLRGPGDLNFLAMAVRRLGQLAVRAGDNEKALEYCRESLRLNRAVSDPRGILACLASFAAIAIAEEEYARAAALAASVEAQIVSVGIGLLYTDRLEYQRNVGILRRSLSAKALDAAWRKGRALSVEEAVEFALQVV